MSDERTVVVGDGTWDEAVILSDELPSGVVLRGEETARTLLTGGVTVRDAIDARISHFTFSGEGPAVAIGGGAVTVANNVFRLDDGEVAIAVSLDQPDILNNVFYRGGVAIDAGENAVVVENNAFFETADTVVGALAGSAISANAFSGVPAIGTGSVTGNPLFVDPAAGDFHLRAGSPLIDAGAGSDALDDSDADIGAYGGEFAEGRPFPVQGLSIVSADSDGLASRVELQWQENRWYRIGGYRLHYGRDAGPPYEGSGADEGDSPIEVEEGTSFTVNGLSGVNGEDLAAPVLAAPEPRDRALLLSWSAVPGASGYVVRYREDGADEDETVDVGAATSHTLGGLENGTEYRVHVAAYAEGAWRFAVTAWATFDAGLDSDFSEEVTAVIGERAEGPPSNEVVDFPEAVVAFPDLADRGGCFIATAAYGYYGAREVRILRRFRDDYLMTNAPGRALVAWYYARSPGWVEALETRPWLGPVTRAALAPAVIIAAVFVHAPAALWVMAIAGVLLAAAVVRRRREAR